MGHRHNVPSLVDGAQSAGAIPIDMSASRVDFYAMPGQKWLCGPEGIGALYVRSDRLDLLSPTFVGFNSFGNTTSGDLDGDLLPAQGSLRYEVGTIYRPGIKAMAKNLNWLQETIGWDWIYSRIAHLAGYTYDSLKSLAGVSIITPPCPQAGMITFTLDGCDLGNTMAKMDEENIIIRSIKPFNGLRVSTGFYNTEEDIDRLVSVLKKLLNSS
jgi:L-cysteine/cystine lyase